MKKKHPKNNQAKTKTGLRNPAEVKSDSGNENGKFLERRIFRPGDGKMLALRIVLALAIPYAFLMLCGLIFDRWLHWYFMTTWIFIFLCLFVLAAIAYIVLCVKNYAGRKK